jgi:hypothetical protein
MRGCSLPSTPDVAASGWALGGERIKGEQRPDEYFPPAQRRVVPWAGAKVSFDHLVPIRADQGRDPIEIERPATIFRNPACPFSAQTISGHSLNCNLRLWHQSRTRLTRIILLSTATAACCFTQESETKLSKILALIGGEPIKACRLAVVLRQAPTPRGGDRMPRCSFGG